VSVMYRRYGLVGAGTSPSFDRLNMLYQRIFPSCLGGGEEGASVSSTHEGLRVFTATNLGCRGRPFSRWSQ
jgi:hypothetical protein